MVTETKILSFVVNSIDEIPLHLRDRVPFTLTNTEAIFKSRDNEALAPDGRVLMAGAIEFQTQITPGRLTDVCDPNELYKTELRLTHRFRCVYDPEIQRGVKETGSGTREFLRRSEIDSMIADIDANQFECPQLMWNLRTGETTWVYVRESKELHIYEGVATRPDTNHRHHAIIEVHRKYLQWVRDTESLEMGTYNPARPYGLVIYTDDAAGEAHRFYIYNFMGWRVSTSTAHYIESKAHTPQLYSRLARELMERSPILGSANVEILSNHLSRNSAKLVTFGTLVDALKRTFPALTEDNYDDALDYSLAFINELGDIRPDEIALLSVARRQRVRETSVADQAVLWHAYLRLAARLRELRPIDWRTALAALGQPYAFSSNGHLYEGDLFSRSNPAWSDFEVIAQGQKGPRVVNNRQSRQGAYDFLCKVVGIEPRESPPATA